MWCIMLGKLTLENELLRDFKASTLNGQVPSPSSCKHSLSKATCSSMQFSKQNPDPTAACGRPAMKVTADEAGSPH